MTDEQGPQQAVPSQQGQTLCQPLLNLELTEARRTHLNTGHSNTHTTTYPITQPGNWRRTHVNTTHHIPSLNLATVLIHTGLQRPKRLSVQWIYLCPLSPTVWVKPKSSLFGLVLERGVRLWIRWCFGRYHHTFLFRTKACREYILFGKTRHVVA